MQKKVGIAGYAMVNSLDIGMSRERALFELVKGLHGSVGITRDDVDSVVLCTNDFYVGHTISNVFEDCPTGSYMKNETKVEMDGVMAVTYAFARVLTGLYDITLVVGGSQGGSVMRPYLMMDYTMSPVYDRQLGLLNELSAGALQARSYMDTFGLTEARMDDIAASMLQSASKNPDAIDEVGATAADVAASELLYEPLRKLHCYPFTDGYCAMIVASEDRIKDLTDNPVWIKGVGDSMDTYYPERDFARVNSVRLAGERAFKMADLAPSDIDVAEVSAKFAHQQPIICEGLGLAPEGSCGDGYSTAVDPSGGGLGAYAFNAAGLNRVAECCKQLTGKAGEAQVDSVKTALAHGQDGLWMQHNGVMILSSEEG